MYTCAKDVNLSLTLGAIYIYTTNDRNSPDGIVAFKRGVKATGGPVSSNFAISQTLWPVGCDSLGRARVSYRYTCNLAVDS